MGKLSLLLGHPYDALSAYAKAVSLSAAGFMIETSLASLERIADAAADIDGIDWAQRLLAVGAAARDPSERNLRRLSALATGPEQELGANVVIVSGGTDATHEEVMQAHGAVLVEGFAGYEGSLISGGTTAGVARLVGDIGERHGARLTTIGYLPSSLPSEVTTDEDPRRYRALRRTAGDVFSPMEPLAYWTDILAAGVNPSRVRLLGIGGGAISALEYRIALGMGAWVGVIEDTGRAASDLLEDPDWLTSPRLVAVAADPSQIKAFVSGE
jgi:hypothetical protein